MLNMIGATIYLFLPAYGANMAPVIAKHLGILSFLAIPIDRGKHFLGKPVLGQNKTVRGMVVGTVVGMVIGLVQHVLVAYPFFEQFTLFSVQNSWGAAGWGALMGGGALMGDAGKSFIKRRLGITPGRRWFPWDQLDMVIGAMVFGSVIFPFYQELSIVLLALILTPLLGVVVNIAAYLLRVKEAW